ncbi:MAG TPA: DUF4123 domain-containing protein [Candidatus Koribacter sp.]|jgi:hypothetical protein
MTTSKVEVQPGSQEQLEKFASNGFLYAILDATGAPAVPAKAVELGIEKAVSLFGHSRQQDHWKYAPYLVRVDGALLQWIRQSVWANPWGIFVMSNADFVTVATHLRSLLRVRLKTGQECIFRYYDPRVLKSFLTGCTAEESAVFFAQVRAFGVNEKDTVKLLVHAAS